MTAVEGIGRAVCGQWKRRLSPHRARWQGKSANPEKSFRTAATLRRCPPARHYPSPLSSSPIKSFGVPKFNAGKHVCRVVTGWARPKPSLRRFRARCGSTAWEWRWTMPLLLASCAGLCIANTRSPGSMPHCLWQIAWDSFLRPMLWRWNSHPLCKTSPRLIYSAWVPRVLSVAPCPTSAPDVKSAA